MAGAITVVRVRENKARGLTKIKASVTVDASGVATATEIGSAFGRLVAVGYKPGDLDTGVDLTLTDADTGATVFSLTNAGTTARYIRPTAVITDVAGAAVTAAATANDVNRDIFLAGSLKLAAAQGGVSKSGELHLLIDEGVA